MSCEPSSIKPPSNPQAPASYSGGGRVWYHQTMDLKIASPERRADARLRRIISMVSHEREHQRRRWTDEADKRRTPADWIAVLSIFIGKAAMETPLYQAKLSTTSFKKRIVQIAAICMAILEAIDEGGTDEG